MATAKSPLSLYAETPEDVSAVQQYQDAQKKLLEALEGRQQLFDPTLLAMAQGFLSPTKTGSFGEALGNVANQVAPVQAAEEKRAQELAKMRFELAQANLGQSQATRGEREMRNLIGRMSGEQPGAAGATPAGGAGAAPAQGAPSSAQPVTAQDIARLAIIAPDKAKILSDMIKNDRDRYVISMNGIVFDRDKQQYLNLEIPGQKQEPFTTKHGTFNMTPGEYSQYKQAEAAGNGKKWIDEFRGVASTTGGTSAPATGRLTVEEQAAKSEGAKTRETETAKAEVGRTQDLIGSGRDATGRLAAYSSLRSIASRPDASEIFGIFNRPDFATAVLNMIQEGVRSSGSSIQAGALEDTMRNIGLPQEQIDRYRYALSTMANIQLQQAKLAAGQGAVSNFERDLFANATISPKDNPSTILAKLSMLEARANFDKKVASALRRSKKSADEFMESGDYDNMVQEYMNTISGISQKIGVNAGGKAPGTNKFRFIGVERQ